MPVEIYSVHEVIEEVGTSNGSHLKTFEITMKNFDDLERDMNQPEHDVNDPDWTPDNAQGNWKAGAPDEGPSASKKERKPARRSVVWDHFQKSESKTEGTCLHCGKVIKLGTISNLARHLRMKHPTTPLLLHNNPLSIMLPKQNITISEADERIMQMLENEANICTEVVEVNVDNLENPSSIIETRTNESRKELEDLPEYPFHVGIETNATQSSQTEFLDDNEDFDINDFIRPKKRAVVAEQVDRQLVKTIVKGCHPVSMVDQPAFRDFVSLLNPRYVLPSASKIASELIPDCYQECEKKTTKSLKSAEGVCLYLDQWTSKTHDYLCVTAHIINSECEFEAMFLSCHILTLSEEATEITERLLETARDWEITDKITAVVSDNRDIVSNAVRLCGWPHIPNFVKTLCQVVHYGLQTIKSLVCKVKNLIHEISKRPEFLAEVYSTQKSLKLGQTKLITKVKTEWSSSFVVIEMLVRFEKLKTAISLLQKNNPNLQPKMSDSDWRNISSIVEVLNIFKGVKKEAVEENRMCLSKMVFYIKALKNEMRKVQNSHNYTSEATFLATTLESSLNKQFEDLDKTDVTVKNLLLDPRLKKHVFEEESEFVAANSKLKKEICEVTLAESQYPEPNPKSLWNHFDNEVQKLTAVKDPIGKGILELENYLQEQLLSRKENPLVWWKQRKAIYPRMFKLAKKYLCVTSKSTPKESISYRSAYMLSHLKYSETSPTESEVLFLHHNM